ncbi:MAG TPA: ClbS/DfsB family four-helix bundle protein [Candidatus Dormibacteraeota bacterium]|nr:ClbS/DfsB family four-helix bundle protein [Candidatus Dormibacteraeota bacterium]
MNGEVEKIDRGWSELSSLVDALGADGLTRSVTGGWAVKDHLVHIAAWELSLLALLNGHDRKKAMGVPQASDETDALNEAVWLLHRHETPDQVLKFSRDTHAALMARVRGMSDADLRRSYNHYQPDDPRDPGDDRPVIEWIAGDTYDHYAEHIRWINQLMESSASR